MKDDEGIDTTLFIEIICSEGAVLLTRDEVNGDTFEWYLANGKRKAICITDEFISKSTAVAYLRQLGFRDLIDRF